jgi:glycogen(starch) synthase
VSRRLHVLLIPAYYPAPENPLSGPFMRDLAMAISLRNCVTVLAPPSAASPSDAVVDGIRTVRVRQGRVDTIQRLLALDATISRLRSEGTPVDILHAHNFLTGAVAVTLGRLRKLPVVITENQSRSLTGELSAHEEWLARFAYRLAPIVCPVSRLSEDRLRLLQPRGRYKVVPDVVDIDRFAAVQRTEERCSPAQIVSVSNLIRRKGLDYLIEAMRLLVADSRDLALTIVGEGPERAALATQARGMRVTLPGSLSREKILELLRDADVFAMPTLGDPFGIAAVEALAAGVPVVVTSASGSADLLARCGATVVEPGDAGALSSGLASALDARPVAPKATIDALRDYCGIEAIGARLDAVYREALAHPAPGP